MSATSTGILRAGNPVDFNSFSTLVVRVNGTTPGTEYDRLEASGVVHLSGCTLDVTFGYASAVNDSFTILTTSANGRINGVFQGLPNNATFCVQGHTYQITYTDQSVQIKDLNGPPTGDYFEVTTLTPNPLAGTKLDLKVVAMRSDSSVDTGYTGTVQITYEQTTMSPYSDDDAGLRWKKAPGPSKAAPFEHTFVPSEAGAFTFRRVKVTVPGPHLFVATDEADSSITGCCSIDITTYEYDRILQLSGPRDAVQGQPFSLTVSILDALGDLVSDYVGTVHFTSSGANDVLPADYTFTAADGGTHTFTVTPNTTGRQSITATDVDHPAITDSATFYVRAAGPRFEVSAPPEVVQGRPFLITVTVLDLNGDVNTNYAGTVHFTSSGPNDVLPADYTFTAADGGAHSFLVIPGSIGRQSVTVKDTDDPSLAGRALFEVLPP
jgi:hypothetical protein